MSSVQVGAIKKALSVLWKYRDPIAEAILFLADLIAKTAKKDHEAEGVTKNATDTSMG
jgi:hypothetical protein